MFSQSNPATDGFCLRVSEGPEMLELDFVSRRDSKVHDRRKRVGTSKARGSGEAAKRRSETPLWLGRYMGI
jgi:hypothetical protein